MKTLLSRLKDLLTEHSKSNLIMPEDIGAEEGSTELLDLNIKNQLTKYFLKQAVISCDEGDHLLMSLLEKNITPAIKIKIDDALKTLASNITSDKALTIWEKLVAEQFTSVSQRLYINKRLTEILDKK